EGETIRRSAEEHTAVTSLHQVEARLTGLRTEAEALRALVAPAPDADTDESIVAALQVAAGFETAIGALFEDELAAPIADGEASTAASFWVGLPRMED